MTVVVASVVEGAMSADTMALDSDEETWIPCTKMFRAGDHLLGFAGSMSDIRPLVTWYRRHPDRRGEPPAIDDDTEMLILTKAGMYAYTRGDGLHKVDGKVHAIGAGKQCALVAMDCGADTRRAAALAVKHSAKCAGSVITRKLRA